MTVTLHSTSAIVEANGVKCRIWEGTTKSGIQVHALIPRIAAHKDADLREFEAELQEQAPPLVDGPFALRIIL